MSTPRSSVLVPLNPRTKPNVAAAGVLNPSVGASLSSTPSPTVTPSFSQNLGSLSNNKLPALSPAPSPPMVSSSLVAPPMLPLVSPGSSPRIGMSPSPRSESDSISQSLSNLSAMPPSPKMTPSPRNSGALPVLPIIGSSGSGNSSISSSGSNIDQSLRNLQSMPPSPRLSSPRLSSSSLTSSLPPSPRMSTSSLAASMMSESPVSNMPVSNMPISNMPISNMSTSDLAASLMDQPPSPRLSKLGGSSPRLSPKLSSSSGKLSPMGSLPPLSPSSVSRSNLTSPLVPPTGSLSSSADDNLKPLSTKPTKVYPDSPSTASFHDYQGMIQDKSVEQMLTESGYLPVDKILTKDENGNLMCQYIKSVDATGRTSFVDLDCEGYVSVDPKDMTMVNGSNNASVVPYSVKMGTYECASSDVCGVAFECDNEICTLKRADDSLTPSETVFTQSATEAGHKKHGMLDNHPISYPIVSLSDIKANPERVACSIKDAHDRMRNASFGQVSQDTSGLVSATKSLNNEISRFNTNQKAISASLTNTIAQLEKIHAQYKKSPPSSDHERSKLRSVHYNLRKRHDMVVDHLKLSESVNSRVDRIRELSGEVKALNDYTEKLFAGLDGVYSE